MLENIVTSLNDSQIFRERNLNQHITGNTNNTTSERTFKLNPNELLPDITLGINSIDNLH